jgi:WD40 repeat protein
MIVACPACAQKMAVPDGQPGTRWLCPKCKAPVEAPPSRPEDTAILDAEVLEDPPEEHGGTYQVGAADDNTPDTWYEKAGGLGVIGTLSLEGEPGMIRCLAMNADTRLGLVGCEERVMVFDLGARKRAYPFDKQEAEVSSLAISPDGKLALSGDEDGGLLLWDINEGKRLRWLEGHEDAVRCVAFSPKGRFAASGGDDGSIRLWEVATGQPRRLSKALWDGPVRSVAFSSEGGQLLAAGEKVRTWSTRSGEILARFPGGANMHSAAFSRDGSEVAACAPEASSSNGFRARRWKALTGQPLAGFEAGASGRVDATATAVAPGSLRVIVMGKKEGVRKASPTGETFGAIAASGVSTFAVTLAFGGLAGFAWRNMTCEFKSGCRFITYEADPYCLKCWSFVNGLPDTHSGGKEPTVVLAVSPDGSKALSATRSNLIDLWSLPSS